MQISSLCKTLIYDQKVLGLSFRLAATISYSPPDVIQQISAAIIRGNALAITGDQGDMPRRWLRDTDIQNGDALFCFIIVYSLFPNVTHFCFFHIYGDFGEYSVSPLIWHLLT